MQKKKFNCTEAKKIPITEYLASLGFQPYKINEDDFWYLSPLREENHASFKVNRKKNIWYDFGTGEGGSIIDFGIKYHHCSISDFLDKLKDSFSFHQPNLQAPKPAGQKKKTELITATSITSPALCHYLHDRNIPLELAKDYCKEVHYRVNDSFFYAIGFSNNSMGYELRSSSFKGCIAPKNITTLPGNNNKEVAVFEGFFSFLSYLELLNKKSIGLPDLQSSFLILNSLSSLKRSRIIMDRYEKIHLFLDLDKAGNLATQKTIDWNNRCRDERFYFHGYKDFNELLCSISAHPKQKLRSGRKL